MTRTFIALEMNDELQRHLIGVTRRVALVLPSIRWVDPASIHLTLAFLGELTDDQLSVVQQVTEDVSRQARSFSYALTQLGTFGSPRSPRVIWMGLEERSGSLQRLHRILNGQLQQSGFKTDTRPFSPHLTLARVKNPLSESEAQHLRVLLADKQDSFRSPTPYLVRHVCVMKSELQRSGAKYTCLQAYPLGADYSVEDSER